jgi:hypothetical protein
MGNFPREQMPTFISVTGTTQTVCAKPVDRHGTAKPPSRVLRSTSGVLQARSGTTCLRYIFCELHGLPVHNHLRRSMAPTLACRSRREMAAARPSPAMDYPMDARCPGPASLASGTRASRPAARLRTRATWAHSRLGAAVVLRTLALAPTARSSTRLARTRTHSRTTMVSNMRREYTR